MNWLTLLIGTTVVLTVLLDVVWTSLWVGGGAGPVTRGVANLAWGAMSWIGRQRHRIMVLAGPSILTLTVLTWLLLLWAGWFLIFSSEPSAVLTSSTDVMADTSDRIYFAGYTIFTLGNGDFAPNGNGWQVATVLASASGLFTATLAFTYLISVVSAAVSGRAFAAEVAGLGSTAAEVVSSGWDGRSYGGLSLSLQSLSSQLGKLSQQYLAYPVLQYFHAGEAAESPIVALAQLDQILLVSAHGVADEHRAPTVLHNSVRSAIENALEALPDKFVQEAEEPLPLPKLSPLRDAGRPTVGDGDFAGQADSQEGRRKQLLGLLRAHGWSAADLPPS